MISGQVQASLTRIRRLLCDLGLSLGAFTVVIIFPVLQTAPTHVVEKLALHGSIFAAASTLALAYSGTYRTIWRYVGFRDMLVLFEASALTVVGYAGVEILILRHSTLVPVGLLAWTAALLWTANTGFLTLPRLLARLISEVSGPVRNGLNGGGQEVTPVLVVGDAGRMEAFVREIGRTPDPRQRVLGVLSDDHHLHGSSLQGVPVLGSITELEKILAGLSARRALLPTTVVLAKDDASRQDFERIIELAMHAGLKAARLAPVGSFQDGSIVKPIELADLLGRPEVSVDMNAVASLVRGKTILVTGAGGSIGSELCRQIAGFSPAELIVADHGEFNLYSIDKELEEAFPAQRRRTALLDVRDRERVRYWIRATQPDIVFHAAALKHVPLVEEHPIEGICTNVLGTINVADASVEFRVPNMVTISTDKAVHPCNVMGATKRLAEAYCQGLDQAMSGMHRTRFITVRFGNVLGSAGSVVPLFKRQIEAGGPVTVTHEEVMRYFMTIPEAVTLILQAGANGVMLEEERGSIYVLEMGRPVKIVELAKQMIRLCGYKPDEDIKIEIVGLRPGEKLYEEVAYGDEVVEPTRSKSVLKLRPRTTDLRIIQQQVQELRQACAALDHERVLRLLQVSVPEYRPAPIQKLNRA
ncbi:MAG: nucleoside-diphosphate sugar epimerase/dehydratase [Terriglobia bacterium]|nr:nucleoside-diphosphate sugar epimerase/dehydratase [Terriglobia bacterium]